MKLSFSIKQRLSGVALLSLFFVATMAAGGYWGSQHLTDAMADIVVLSSAQRNELQADMMRMALHGDVLAALQAGAAQNDVSNSAIKDTVLKDMEEHATLLRENIANNLALPLHQDLKNILNQTQPAVEAYIEKVAVVIKLAFEDNAAANAKLPEYINTFKLLAGTMSALGELMDETMKEAQDAGDARAAMVKKLILITVILAWIALSIISLLLIRSITRPLLGAVKLAHTVASGDLTSAIEIKTRDETGKMMQALKDMNDSLVKIVSNVRTSVDAITVSAKEIAAGNSDLSQRTEEQASSLQETASSMEELSATVKHNAENAKQANQLSLGARDVAVKGGDIVNRVVTTMASINDSSNKIVDIISVIEGIAFQTNILALNAAVEAARAGEQGRGFAVVAAEVRTLAQRSAGAAKEIKALIDDSVGKIKGGTKLVDEAGKTMDEIVTAVKRMTDIMAEISAASSEQSSGIDQVNQAINQMDEVTQQNAALVEEAAAAAEAMKEEAENLTLSVSVFKLSTQAEPRSVSSSHHRSSSATPNKPARPSLPPLEKRKAGRPKGLLEKQAAGEWEEF